NDRAGNLVSSVVISCRWVVQRRRAVRGRQVDSGRVVVAQNVGQVLGRDSDALGRRQLVSSATDDQVLTVEYAHRVAEVLVIVLISSSAANQIRPRRN